MTVSSRSKTGNQIRRGIRRRICYRLATFDITAVNIGLVPICTEFAPLSCRLRIHGNEVRIIFSLMFVECYINIK